MCDLADHSTLHVELFHSQVGRLLHLDNEASRQGVNLLLKRCQRGYCETISVFHSVRIGHVADLQDNDILSLNALGWNTESDAGLPNGLVWHEPRTAIHSHTAFTLRVRDLEVTQRKANIDDPTRLNWVSHSETERKLCDCRNSS